MGTVFDHGRISVDQVSGFDTVGAARINRMTRAAKSRFRSEIIAASVFVVTLSISGVVRVSAAMPAAPKAPLCEGEPNPTDVTDYSPEFAWVFKDSDIDDSQSAYQILLAADLESLQNEKPDRWDSGKVTTSKSLGVSYRGRALSNHQTYYWQVRIWDNADHAGPYCAPQSFTTGECKTVLDGYFAIGAYMCPEAASYKDYARANFNTIIAENVAACDQFGLKFYAGQLWDVGRWFEIGEQLDNRISGAAHGFGGELNYLGQFLADEPWPDQLDVMSYATRRLNALDPEHPTRAIVHPATAAKHQEFLDWTYRKYISYYCRNLCTNIIEYDDYPFLNERTETDFYDNMEIIRDNALASNMHYWFCLQSQGSPVHRNPDEGELRFSVYSAITYGFKGITYYCYTSQPVRGGHETGLVDENYVPNQKWHWAETINAEVKALAPRLSRLHSEKVYHTKSLPIGTAGITGHDHVIDVTGGRMVVGEFKHEKTGIDYLALMNSDHENGHDYTVMLNPRIGRISRISKMTGKCVPVPVLGNRITVKLAAGDGDLYVINPDDAPPSVPANVRVMAVGDGQIDVAWNASIDPESGIQFYQIYRNGKAFDTSADSTYSDTHLSGHKSYTYEVSAVNWESLESGRSNPIQATVDE